MGWPGHRPHRFSRLPGTVRVFSIDYRSLALFRIALGLVLLYSLATLAAVGDMVLAQDGLFPNSLVERSLRNTWSWSVNWLVDATWFQWLVLAAAAAAVGCMVVGWRTRVVTVVAWVLVTSIFRNVSPALGGGDVLLNLLLFWAMFLPLGAKWSLDARHAPPLTETSLTSPATMALLLQMAFMYFFTGISKFNDVWFSGAALSIGFSIDRVTRPLGHWLDQFPWITAQISRGTLVAELVLPFVLFSPWKSLWCRSVALAMLIAFHLGIEATMIVGTFSFASLAGLTPFVPSEWWSVTPLQQLESLLDRVFPIAPPAAPPAKPKRDKRAGHRQPGRGPWRWIVDGLVVLLIVYVLIYNAIVSFASNDLKRSLGSFQRWGELLALKQYWNMFSDPSPNCNEIAYLARLRDGTQIDLLRDNVAVDDATAFPATPAKYDRLRKMIWASVVTYPDNRVFLDGSIRYVCREYNQTIDDPQQEIAECRLIYYPYGANPFKKEISYTELHRVAFPPGQKSPL